MALHEMSSHSCARRNGPLQIYIAVLLELAEIRSSQSLGCNTDFERGSIELGYCEAGAIYADTVAEVAIV